MPVAPTYPGVYVEEIPSGVHTIVGVTTAVTAFIDGFARGAMDEAVQIFSWEDFRREYGGLDESSEASYAVWQFYQNGGGEAWVVRCAPAATPGEAAAIVMEDLNSAAALTLKAASPGTWGNSLQARIDPVDATTFDLKVSELSSDGMVVRQETFRGLTAATAKDVVNAGSQLVQVVAVAGVPVANGTTSGQIAVASPQLKAQAGRSIKVQVGSDPAVEVKLGDSAVQSLADARDLLQAAIQSAKPASPAWAGVTVEIDGATTATPQLRILAGPSADPSATIVVTNGSDSTADELFLTAGAKAVVNVQAYTPGPAVASTFQAAGKTGSAAGTPDVAALQAALQRLKDVGFNLLSIPMTATMQQTDANAVISTATAYCESRRAFLIVDPPFSIVTVPKIKDWLNQNATLRSRNSAVYWPALQIGDTTSPSGLRTVGPSGTMAGVYARTDSERGVWKAPAGTDAVLRGVQALNYVLNDPENGTINPVAINALRTFPIYGTISWGARTTKGADAIADEYKYIPPRRLALYIEETLLRGLKWVVFEPNDEPLWGQIRLNVGAFMHDLFRQGAFQGTTPREAYLVKCDGETTTQNDINLGIVNIVVGFAPLKPAEFVIIQIQQLAGQIQV